MPVLERPQHKTYTIVYNTGLPGEWFSWFINMHKGFPRIDFLDIRTETTKPGQEPIAHQGRVWVPESRKFENHEGDHWTIERTEFETAIEKGLEMGVGDFDKLIIKIHPYHYLNYIWDNFKKIHNEKSNITNHVVLEVGDKDILGILEADHEFYRPRHRPKFQYSVTPKWEGLMQSTDGDLPVFEDFSEGFRHYKSLFEDKGVHVDRIDIAKIFQHDVHEYYRLLNIIDSPPLKDWKNLVKEYTDFRFEGIKFS